MNTSAKTAPDQPGFTDSPAAQAEALAAFLADYPIYETTKTLDEQLDLEAETQGELGRSEDFREGVNAFLQKRPARFQGK